MTRKTYKRFKLTDQNQKTYNGFKWKVNKWYGSSGEGDLCDAGWLHCYAHPLLAVLHNPVHADIINPILWECEVRGECKCDSQMKEGWTDMRIVREIPLPKITTEQRIKYGILCAKAVCDDKDWNRWADKWLSGEDRSKDAAERAAENVVRAAMYAARAAENVVRAAMYAARAEENETWAAENVTWAEENETWAAENAARAAAYAVEAEPINLIKLAKKVVEE